MENKVVNKEAMRMICTKKKIVHVLYTLEPPLGGDSEHCSLLRRYSHDLRKKDRRYISKVYV